MIKKFLPRQINTIHDELNNMVPKNTRGYLKFMNGKNNKGYFLEAGEINDISQLSQVLNRDYQAIENSYLSIATYKSNKNARKQNILDVWCLAIDADYTLFPGQSETEYETAYRALQIACMDGFPRPTKVEHSRNMRLYYVFNAPYIIPQNRRKGATLTFLERISQCLASGLNKINDIINFNASAQKLTTFIRIPESLNVRNKWGIDRGTFGLKLIESNCWDVELDDFGYLWDVDKLADAILPELPSWYYDWKKNKARKRKKNKNEISRNHILYSNGFCEGRLEQLRELQRRGYDVGYRHNMCMLFWLTCRQAGYNEEQTFDKLREFNSNFKTPFAKDRDLRSAKPADFKVGGMHYSGWQRKYKDSTIRTLLGLGKYEIDLFTGKGRSKAEISKAYRERKYRKEHNGLLKKEQMLNMAMQVWKLRADNHTWKEIAGELDICEKTARNYISRFRVLMEEVTKTEVVPVLKQKIISFADEFPPYLQNEIKGKLISAPSKVKTQKLVI